MSQLCNNCKEKSCLANPNFRETDLKGFASIRKKYRCMKCPQKKQCSLKTLNKYRIKKPMGIIFITGVTSVKCRYYK